MDRFWSKVDKGPGCWEWKAFKRTGYGLFRVDKKMVSAHRYSYELTYGSIPEGQLIRHKCDNRGCVRPDHLELGSYFDNSLDMKQRDRGLTRLNNAFVCEARRRTAGGESIYSIMKDAPEGITTTVLSNAIRGKTFKHLLDPQEPIFDKPLHRKLSPQAYKEIYAALEHNYHGLGIKLAETYNVDPSMITLIKQDRLKTIHRVSSE